LKEALDDTKQIGLGATNAVFSRGVRPEKNEEKKGRGPVSGAAITTENPQNPLPNSMENVHPPLKEHPERGPKRNMRCTY